MIDIRFIKKDSKLVSFKVSGHAEYYEGDEVVYDDLVCGVVSNLAQVTILGVTEVLKLKAPYVAEEGNIQLDISQLGSQEIDKCSVLLETMLVGLKSLEVTVNI